ncbi:hypothetical protein [Falsibacillus pallidus]|uniref:Uncharacterized protein n=1 Tax=Falsibacillus pallidus TaxID=493781 RepID=A0A370GPJ4_9BACI|nr:hypothetical protein [Falsibacillus pallidus]RDI45658.1 hypothetical protein DFR59_102290 [Falsibacillus pallidus]
MTQKELSYVEDEIRAEEITAKTLNWCASMCLDIELRDALADMAERHQLRIAALSKYFHESGPIQ